MGFPQPLNSCYTGATTNFSTLRPGRESPYEMPFLPSRQRPGDGFRGRVMTGSQPMAAGSARTAVYATPPTNASRKRAVKIVKKDGTRQPFDRTKIKRGLELACWKRPVSDAQLESIVTEVQNELESHSEPEIQSRDVGELVMKYLRAVNQVAYVRFASVYRQFEDVHDFVHELKPMLAAGQATGGTGETVAPGCGCGPGANASYPSGMESCEHYLSEDRSSSPYEGNCGQPLGSNER